MTIHLHNTLSQTKEPLRTLEPGKVRMYVCGPTVYSASHVGHMVGPVIFDTLKRFLTYRGYQVTWVVNITDIDDKLIVQANKDGVTVKSLAEQVTADYVKCLEALGVDGIDHMPKATEHIDHILEMTQGLIDKGYAYASGGDVYFDVTKAEEYGKLSHRDPEALLAGNRVEPSSHKRHPGDFALWKAAKPGEPFWESPWGPGRPGWHIECSAMSRSLLGDQIDIHGGGLDLVFPHHENEVVQSECFTGRKPFATFWLHNGLLTKDGRKISKSDPDTIVLMRDLLSKYQPDTLRALFLMGHYRRPTDYGNQRLDEIERGLQAFFIFFERFERITGRSFYTLPAPQTDSEGEFDPGDSDFLKTVRDHRLKFLEALDDDFNTGGGFGELFELLRTLNRFADRVGLERADAPHRADALAQFERGVTVLRELTRLFGLFRAAPRSKTTGDDQLTAGLMRLVIDLRASLRKEKNFALADEIRRRLAELNVTLEDGPGGTRWRIG